MDCDKLEFKVIRECEWVFSDRISGERRSLLLSTKFEKILELLHAGKIEVFCLEPKNNSQSKKRAKIALKLDPLVVDLFHNGAGGYRAQYYYNESLGELANRHAVEVARVLLQQCSDIMHNVEFADCSLQQRSAKIWIRESGWHSDNLPSNRNLFVQLWENNMQQAAQLMLRFEPSWARLTPSEESILEIKGGWLDQDLSPSESFKPTRSQEIHDYGYT